MKMREDEKQEPSGSYPYKNCLTFYFIKLKSSISHFFYLYIHFDQFYFFLSFSGWLAKEVVAP